MQGHQRELTSRERQVLQAIADGYRNHEIAVMLGITEETVKSHIKHILRVTGTRSRAHAVTVGMRTELIS